jgi:hypothetical protein
MSYIVQEEMPQKGFVKTLSIRLQYSPTVASFLCAPKSMGLKYGDLVILTIKSNPICGEGLLSDHLSLQNIDEQRIDECLFCVHPQLQYSATEEFDLYMSNCDGTSVSDLYMSALKVVLYTHLV